MLQLTHIGETLISEMFNTSARVKKLLGAKLDVSITDETGVVSVPEVPLHHCGQYRFDGTHRIDVGILNRESGSCIPIEAKLGTDRLAKNTFNERFLKPCGTSHAEKRIMGSMISVLERNLPVSAGTRIDVLHDGQCYQVTPVWALIVRGTVAASWHQRGMPSFSSNCRILAIEEIVHAFGNATDFDNLVMRIVGAGHYQRWFT